MLKIVILRDSNPEMSYKWELACQKQGVEYIVVDMMRHDWLERIKGFNPNFCVSRPPGVIQQDKQVFDQKLYFIEKYLGLQVFPGYGETVIYENKATLAYFLQSNDIPHPNTFISYSKEESLGFAQGANYPLVAKTLIGAAGSGVKISQNRQQAQSYIEQAFTTGIKRRFGPNPKTGTPTKWLTKAIKSPSYFFKKLKEYKKRDGDVQKGVVLFQEYVEHNYEWRCVKIGESYFAYKKLKIGDKASGSKEFEYGEPPVELLDFTRELCQKHNFNFMAVDLFYVNNQIYVNELQTIFGHKNPYICKVDGKKGRYLYQNNQWVFEEGDFNANESYDLRLSVAIKLYEQIRV